MHRLATFGTDQNRAHEFSQIWADDLFSFVLRVRTVIGHLGMFTTDGTDVALAKWM